MAKNEEIKERKDVTSVDEDAKITEYLERLSALRADGIIRITDLREQITSTRRNKMLEKEAKGKLIASYRTEIEKARKIETENRAEISRLTKESVAYVNEVGRRYEETVNADENRNILSIKQALAGQIRKIKADGAKRREKIRAGYVGKNGGQSKKDMKDEIATAKYEMRSAIFDAKSRAGSNIDRAKSNKYQACVDRVQKNRALRNGRTNYWENQMLQRKAYAQNFTMKKFLLDNGLYLAILVFFIVCIIIAPTKGYGSLFSLPNILTILEQSSTRMFYALGVAGLILLAGTDLSVGRMVAMGSVVTGLILHPGMNIVTFFNKGPWNFTGLPMGLRVVMSLLFSIILCVAFSAFAGFFSAKLKIHPFISTLATQLIIYGLLFFGTSGTPVGSIDSMIKDKIGGRWIIGQMNDGSLITFPKLIIPAIIACIVAWFIWNKTTFGKNMYAVGGNAEAAAVSGISVFWVTLGVFIMAGIFYGCGAFLEAFRANASAGTGQGFELDAIAACVVGGISFNGGIGKISGAVIGVISFTRLTYCLTFLGIDTNLHFVFKGLIIIAAVALDSVKYLKRK
ncbi:MAG: galactoside ABC transporter permease [Sphaerochaetaceae bacterium]